MFTDANVIPEDPFRFRSQITTICLKCCFIALVKPVKLLLIPVQAGASYIREREQNP